MGKERKKPISFIYRELLLAAGSTNYVASFCENIQSMHGLNK